MALPISRRQLLALPLGLLVLPRTAMAEGVIRRHFAYRADMGVLFDFLTFHVTGTVTGGCIATMFRKALVPPFSGDYVTVKKTVTLK